MDNDVVSSLKATTRQKRRLVKRFIGPNSQFIKRKKNTVEQIILILGLF